MIKMRSLLTTIFATLLFASSALAQISGPMFPGPGLTIKPLVCTLLNGNGSAGPGTLINDANMTRASTAWTNTGPTAYSSGPIEGGGTSPAYIGMDYGVGVTKQPCKFTVSPTTNSGGWWSGGGTAGTITLTLIGYSSAPSTTASTACAGGTSLANSSFAGTTSTTQTVTVTGAAGYRYLIICVANSNLQSGSLIYSAQQIWDLE
jgi:hypothetical protein